MSTSDTGRDDTLCYSGCDGTFDDGGNRVHRTNDFGLELRGYMEFDLLEEIL